MADFGSFAQPVSFDPVFFILSVPVALALLAGVYFWLKKKMEKKKEEEQMPGENRPEPDFSSGFR